MLKETLGDVFYNERVGVWFFSPQSNMELEYMVSDWGEVSEDDPYGVIVANINEVTEEAYLIRKKE